jgi:two-component sensor histidine kinase
MTQTVKLETKIANALGRSYRELDIIDDKDLLPSFGVLRAIAQNMVELFVPSVGDVATAFDLTRFSFPAFKRRTLVLACSELLVNVLQHAFVGRLGGLVVVTLCDLDDGRASLLVADSGRGMGSAIRSPHWGVAADLAELLDCELSYPEVACGGTVAELRFRTDPETVQNPGGNNG